MKTPEKYSEREHPLDHTILTTLPDGTLNPNAVGWARQPIQISNLRGHALRKKRWNYWALITPECLFSVTLSNIDYMGLAFVYFLDFETKRFYEKTAMSLFGKGCDLPETVEGPIEFNSPEMKLAMDDRGQAISIFTECPDFGGQKLEAHLSIERPAGLESLNIMIPWSHNRYHYTSKQNCLATGGTVTVGDRTYTADAARDFSCLDFGRGIWKYATFWNWSSFSTRIGSELVGVNLGAGWTDGSNTTENSLLIDGKVEKIGEDVIFTYDTQNFMTPWKIKSAFGNQVDLTFTPFYERIAKTEAVVIRSEVHQMIGTFKGTLTSQNGKTYKIDGVTGWAEDHHARW